jgi:iron complex outermembrane receptor protein
VGVYIDEIPVSTFTAEGVNLKTFDVERLEVLRGPQGTLYGEGSLGGTIRIITNKPDPTRFAAKANAGVATTKGGGTDWSGDLMLNAPVSEDRLALRAVVSWRDSSGWIDNPVLGATDINFEQSLTARLAARAVVSDRFTLDLSYIRQEVESGGPSYGDANNQHFAGTKESRDDNLDIWNLTGTYRFDAATLTFATGYFDRSSFSNNDFTAIAPLLSFLFATPVDTVKITRPNEQKIFTQEIRLTSNGGGPLAWTVGGFYKHNNLVIGNSGVASPVLPVSLYELNVDETAEQYAVFGEADFALTPRLHAVLGARYFTEERDTRSTISGLLPLILSGAAANNLPVSSSEEKVTGKASVYFEATPDALLYATASSGFRAGGINPNAFLFAGAPTSFGPETLWNYEVGAKTTWLNDRLVVNAALYDIEWDNVIVNAATSDPLFGYSVNAGKAHSRGAELEVIAAPVSGLELRFAGNYTEAEIDSVDAIGSTPPAAAPGAKLPFVPAYKLSAGAQYQFALTGALDARVRLDVSHTAKTYSGVDNSAAGVNDAYTKVDARFVLLGERWQVELFAENLGDERGELAAAGAGESLVIRPRTIGLALQARW